MNSLRMIVSKIHTKRERQRERQRERHKRNVILQDATVTNDNLPLLKVTKSLYIVTDLGQLPFMLFT